MGKILEKLSILPIIHIFDWADGDKYTVEEDTTILPPELAESAQRIEEQADKHFKTPSKGNGGKGKSQFKVEKDQLNTEKVEAKSSKGKDENTKGMEIGE